MPKGGREGGRKVRVGQRVCVCVCVCGGGSHRAVVKAAEAVVCLRHTRSPMPKLVVRAHFPAVGYAVAHVNFRLLERQGPIGAVQRKLNPQAGWHGNPLDVIGRRRIPLHICGWMASEQEGVRVDRDLGPESTAKASFSYRWPGRSRRDFPLAPSGGRPGSAPRGGCECAGSPSQLLTAPPA